MLLTHLYPDRRTRAKLLLFAQMAEEPAFDTLRTKEQLGYVVSSSPVVIGTVAGWRLLIQSERSPDYLEDRIDLFLAKFAETLKDMSDTDFESFKVALINSRLERLKNLNQETSRFWHHVTSEMFDFELVLRDVEQVEQLTKKELVEFFDVYINPASNSRSKVAVHLIAQTSAEEVAESTDPKEKVEKLSQALHQLLDQIGVESDRSTLQKRLDNLPATMDVTSVSSAFSSYLVSDVGKPEAEVNALMAQVTPALQQALPAIGITTSVAPAVEPKDTKATQAVLADRKKATVIEDVRLFKASIQLSEGAQPVQDLSTFEDLEPKL